MARPRRADNAPDEQPEALPEIDEQPEGEFDVEAWVAAVYDYRENGGPKPVRTFRALVGEPVHVDAVNAVTAVARAQSEG
jgi:hypothetical protein